MYIKKLQLYNFQVIESFDAEFDGNVYFVTGDNELGKSTLLKAIGALLTGQRDDVLRNGASKGFAKMVVGDDGEEYDVSLSFTEANPRGTLTIKQKSTGMQTNNVSMLQRVFGYQDFDAVEFSRWSETAEGRRKQIAVVKSLLPENVRERIEAIDAEVAELKAERTGINRDVKTYAGFVQTIENQLRPGDVDKYAAPVDVTDLMERQSKNIKLIEKAKTVRSMMAQRKEQLAAIPGREKTIREETERAKANLASEVETARKAYEAAKKYAEEQTADLDKEMAEDLAKLQVEKADYEDRIKNAAGWLEQYEASGVEKADISGLLAEAEGHNKRHALVREYGEKMAEYQKIAAKSAEMDSRIENLAIEKADCIRKSKLPVEGLTFTDEGLELNGIPFVPGKVSDSQTMEIAAKLVIASNPTVKVFRIARGESLGAKRLQTIVDIARKNGFQGFIEQVQRGQEEMRVEEYTEA